MHPLALALIVVSGALGVVVPPVDDEPAPIPTTAREQRPVETDQEWRRTFRGEKKLTPRVDSEPDEGEPDEGEPDGEQQSCPATSSQAECGSGETQSPERARFIGELQHLGVKYGDLFGTRNRKREWETNITNVYRDLSWSVPIKVGTPPQVMNVTVDTGSTTLWIYADCASPDECGDVTSFDPKKSSTFNENNNKPFVQNYGVGGVDGTYGHDVVSIAGTAVSSQQFGLVTYNATDGIGAMKGSTKSGLLGLGWPAGGIGKDPRSWWAESSRETDWPEPMFGIHLRRELDHSLRHFEMPGGHLTLGGLDPSLYTGEVHYVDAVRDSTVYWQVRLDGVVSNRTYFDGSRSDGSKSNVVIDTGTTVALGSRELVARMYAQISGAKVDPTVTFTMLGYDADIYTFPCHSISSLPTMSIRLGGVDYPIYPPDLVVSIDGTTCTGALLGLDSPDDLWLLGGTFLKSVYSVYRYDPPAVGFAALSPAHDVRYQTDDISVLDGSNTIYFDSTSDRNAEHYTSGTGSSVMPTEGGQNNAGNQPTTSTGQSARAVANTPHLVSAKQPAGGMLLLAVVAWLFMIIP